MFTYLHLDQIKRITAFPYPVKETGFLSYYQTEPENYVYSHLEVCLRLSSSEAAFAVDSIDGKTVQTPFPHVIFKLPGHHHCFHASDKREAVFFIYSGEAAQLLRKHNLIPESMIQPISMTAELNQLILRLNGLMMNSRAAGAADKIDLTCFSILEELLFQRQRPDDTIQGRIMKIASNLQMNPEDPPDFPELARRNGFSERSFFRYWSKYFPVSPAKYLNTLKMERAAWLITHTSRSIQEIASSLHYCSDNYFSTSFRKFYKVSPKAYRAGHSAEPAADFSGSSS